MATITDTPFSAPKSKHSVFIAKDLRIARRHLDRTLQPADYSSLVGSAYSDYAFQNYAPLTDRVALSYIRMGKAVEIHTDPLHDFYMVQIPIKGHLEVTYGDSRLRIDPARWSVISPIKPLTLSWSHDCELLEIKIKRSAFETTLAQLSGVKAVSPIEFGLEFRGVGGRADGLYQLLSYICQQLEQSESSLDFVSTRSRLEELILTMLLESQEHNYVCAMKQSKDSDGELSPRFIRLAVEYISSHADEPLRLTDIAAASGASVRSVNAGFRRFRHTTPMEFLRHTRLDYVRVALMKASLHDTTVTEVAYRWGFNHLGRFAGDYKGRFGESPSDTLSHGDRGPK